MFRVTIIRLRDIIKIVLILIAIFILGKIIVKSIFIQNSSNAKLNLDTEDWVKFGISTESTIIKDVSEAEDTKSLEVLQKEKKTKEPKSPDSKLNFILKIGTNIFSSEEVKNQVIENKNSEHIEETTNVTEEEPLPEENKGEVNAVQTEIVTPDPIQENYNKEYDGIKIKNETSYELTDSILDTKDLNINTKNVIIFHTHTCESYTPSESYNYEATREL